MKCIFDCVVRWSSVWWNAFEYVLWNVKHSWKTLCVFESWWWGRCQFDARIELPHIFHTIDRLMAIANQINNNNWILSNSSFAKKKKSFKFHQTRLFHGILFNISFFYLPAVEFYLFNPEKERSIKIFNDLMPRKVPIYNFDKQLLWGWRAVYVHVYW